MKRVFSEIILVGSIVAILLGVMFVGGYIDTRYTRLAIVTSVGDGMVEAKDNLGNVWEFEDLGYINGDVIELSMHTNYTDDYIYDDEVLGAKIIK